MSRRITIYLDDDTDVLLMRLERHYRLHFSEWPPSTSAVIRIALKHLAIRNDIPETEDAEALAAAQETDAQPD